MIEMIKNVYKYSDLTFKIMGCAMTVQSVLGNKGNPNIK